MPAVALQQDHLYLPCVINCPPYHRWSVHCLQDELVLLLSDRCQYHIIVWDFQVVVCIKTPWGICQGFCVIPWSALLALLLPLQCLGSSLLSTELSPRLLVLVLRGALLPLPLFVALSVAC
eukprot:scaffold20268_cov64-Cyclotella_meneghiniana.AAC.15